MTLLLLKRYLKILITGAASLILSSCSNVSTPAQLSVGSAQVVVLVPASLDIRRVNDKKVNSPSLTRGYYHLKLPEGRNSIEIQYTQNWNQADEAGYYVKWQPVLLQAEFNQSTAYLIEYQRPQNREQAVTWSQSPEIWLTATENGVTNELTKKSATPEPSDSQQVETKAIAGGHHTILAQPLPNFPNVIERFLLSSDKTVDYNETQSSILVKLKQRWQQASDSDKVLFKRWINQPATQTTDRAR